MKRWLAPMGSLALTALMLAGVEWWLRWQSPIPDPYNRLKFTQPPAYFIRSAFEPRYQAWTEAEDGLSGMPQGRSRFTINEFGFRGGALRTPKPEGELRIFLLGGSSAECFYLDDAASLDRVLQEELSRRAPEDLAIRVYNAGKSGDRSDDHVAMLTQRLVHLEPDVVVVFAGVNDLVASLSGYDYLHYQDRPRLRLTLPVLLKMAATEFQIPRRLHQVMRGFGSRSAQRILEDIPLKSNYREKCALRALAPKTDAEPMPDLVAYERNLKTLLGVARSHDFAMVFMTQGSTWKSAVDSDIQDWHWMLWHNGLTYGEAAMDEALGSLNEVTRHLAREQRIPLCDLDRQLPKSGKFFYDDVHFNVAGAAAAGTQLALRLVEEGVVPSMTGVASAGLARAQAGAHPVGDSP